MPETPRILTITPNPSLDLLFASDGLVWNDANRIANPRIRPGGQGINLARAARALGADALAVAPLGGVFGAVVRDALSGEGILRAVEIAGATRVFVEARDPGAGSLPLNPRGPTLTPREADALRSAARKAIASHRPHFVVCCGSLAPGLPADFYAGLGGEALAAGAAFVPDCDGEALAAAAPLATVLAPNRFEAERLLATSVRTRDDAARAALELAAAGNGTVGMPRWAAVTLGAEGAVLATGGRVWGSPPPPVRDPGSPVGAGDAFLAGLLIAIGEGRPPRDALAAAVAAGAAVLMAQGPAMLAADDARSLARLVDATPLDLP
ncbi:MAG TPA: PfkB family carbohydrate kinase [Longimicrobiales bacterium]|nr:PfkB family carbohydrate kinase [Longimicrobiales bacterium]